MTSIQDSFFSLDHRFDYEHGLNIAAAFTAFDSETENILRPDIGRIVFREYNWGYDADDKYFVTQNYLPTHVCTKEELGIDQQSSSNSFFPLKNEADTNIVDMY